jgi:hypothetical protein
MNINPNITGLRLNGLFRDSRDTTTSLYARIKPIKRSLIVSCGVPLVQPPPNHNLKDTSARNTPNIPLKVKAVFPFTLSAHNLLTAHPKRP